MKKVGKAFICLSVCVLGTACARAENREPTEEPTVQEYAVTQEESSSKETKDHLTISSADTENTSEQSKHQEDIEMKTDLGISDILIPGAPSLSKIPFMSADIVRIWEYEPGLEKFEGIDRGNGHFNYWKGSSGIEYVTYSGWMEFMAGVILSEGSYSLANGIRAGMTEAELIQNGYPFEKCERGASSGLGYLVLESNLLRDENSPLNTTDYDSIYACIRSVSENEAKEYGLNAMSCYSIVLLIKDGVINKVILDMPNAG